MLTPCQNFGAPSNCEPHPTYIHVWNAKLSTSARERNGGIRERGHCFRTQAEAFQTKKVRGDDLSPIKRPCAVTTDPSCEARRRAEEGDTVAAGDPSSPPDSSASHPTGNQRRHPAYRFSVCLKVHCVLCQKAQKTNWVGYDKEMINGKVWVSVICIYFPSSVITVGFRSFLSGPQRNGSEWWALPTRDTMKHTDAAGAP